MNFIAVCFLYCEYVERRVVVYDVCKRIVEPFVKISVVFVE